MWTDGTVENVDLKTWSKVLEELANVSPKQRREMLAATVMNVQVG